MQRVLLVVSKIFNRIFVTTGFQGTFLFDRLVRYIKNQPFLIIGVVLLIVGYSISLIKRLIHN